MRYIWPDYHNTRRAFSLVEVLSALMIFSIAIIAFMQTLSTSTSVQGELAWRQRAAMLAENILEEIRYTGDLAEGEDSGEFEGGDAAYGWASHIEETETVDLMQVTVTITWSDGGRERDYALTTFMVNEGLGEATVQ